MRRFRPVTARRALAFELLFRHAMRYLVLCSFLVACGFQAPPTAATEPDAAVPVVDASDPGVMTPRVFITQLLTAECDQAFACQPQYPSDAHRSFADEWGTDLTDCLTTDSDYKALGAIEDAIAAGRITFDPVLALSCLAAPGIPTTCSTLFADHYDWAPICYSALAGHVADGGACTTGWECGATSHCAGTKCTPDN